MGHKNVLLAGYGKLTGIIAILFASLVTGITSVSAQPEINREAAVKHIRDVVEQPFLEFGGFSTFDCAITSGAKPTHPFTCEGSTAEGKHYQYLLAIDPKLGLTVDLITEPAAQLDYEWLPALQATCKQFLEQFNQQDWQTMYAGFHYELQKLLTVTTLEADLGPIRDILGLTGDPTLETYSLRDGGRNELQYSVPAKNGKAAFRCGLNADDSGVKVLAYMVALYPDTPLYRTGLEESGAQRLSTFLGEEVIELEIPYELLPNVYDSAEGSAILANGERIKLRVTRHGRLDDFSPYDYEFSVLKDQNE